jgi:hypothetical protein
MLPPPRLTKAQADQLAAHKLQGSMKRFSIPAVEPGI